jgi:2-iminobutanoate/2-iminopropanoate deaminase
MKGSRRLLSSAKVKRPIGSATQAWSILGPGRMIITSGLTSRDNETGAVIHAGDIRAQTRQTFENLKLVLAEDGATLDDAVKVTTYLVRRDDFDAMWEVRRNYFTKELPASTTVIVSGLADERLLIEVEVIAFMPVSQ